MHLFTHRLAAAGCAVFVYLFVCSGKAEAATANTIRDKFELQLSQDIAPLKEEPQRVQRTIRTIHEVELYNAVMASTSADEIDAKISALTATADLLHDTMINGTDLPLENILRYEAGYKKTVDDLSTLLDVRDLYIVDPLPTSDESLETLLKAESSLKSSIKEAGYYENIGSMGYYPVKGQAYKVNSPFGSCYDPAGVGRYNFHYSVDLKAPQGTPVGTRFPGTVESTGTSYGSGNYIWIDHGYGVCSYYYHLSRIDVKEGQNVSQGTQVALSRNTDYYSTGPHLHLGLYIDGTAADPRMVLEQYIGTASTALSQHHRATGQYSDTYLMASCYAVCPRALRYKDTSQQKMA